MKRSFLDCYNLSIFYYILKREQVCLQVSATPKKLQRFFTSFRATHSHVRAIKPISNGILTRNGES